MYVYASLCDYVCIALFLLFVLGSVCPFCFLFFFITFKLYFIFSIFLFFISITIFYLFIYLFFLPSFFLSFFSPFLLSREADRVLVLWPGVKSVSLRWESQIQDTGPPETSQLHVISNGESSPRDLHLNTKTQLWSTTNKLQCWTPHAKQVVRQEHNPIH